MKYLKIVPFVILLTGCSSYQRDKVQLAENGVSHNINDTKVGASTKNIRAIMAQFVYRAGLAGDASEANLALVNATNSYGVFLAGAGFVDEQCDAYLEALESYSKYMQRAKGYTGNAGALTAVVLSAASASTMAIGITAASFGFMSSNIEITQNTLLFALEPSGVRMLVSEQQRAYREYYRGKPNELQDLPTTTDAVRGYLRLCLPTSIRAAVNERVKSTKATVESDMTMKLTND